MASGAAEVCGQKTLDQFQSQLGSNHISTQAEDTHVILFDTMTGGVTSRMSPAHTP
jgi:hypothetical protein